MSALRTAGVIDVVALTFFAGGCSATTNLDGTYTKVESAGGENLTSTLTIDGGDCTLHHAAEPGSVERDETCTVDGDHLVFTEGGEEARLPVAKTDDGDVRIGLGDGELYQRSY